MQFFLLSVMCVIGAVLAKPALTKQKRDILPGDSRYGTDYHHHHHHHHPQESNEIEVTQSLGGYAGSYIAPEQHSHQTNFQVVQAAYGPPNYSSEQTIHYQETVQQAAQPAQHYVPAPSVSISNFEPQVVYQQVAQQQEQHPVASQNNAYLAPAATVIQAPVVYQQPQVVHQQEQHAVASQNNAYLAPAATDVQAPVVHYVPSAPVYSQQVQAIQQRAPVQQQEQHPVASQNNAYLAPAATDVQAPAVQYAPSAPVYTQVQAVQQRAPVQQQVTHHVQQQAVQHVQERVRQVHQAAQPIVHQQIAQIQPAVQHHQIIYQSEPQTYTSGYFGASENSGFTYHQEQSNNQVSQPIGSNGGYVY